MSDGDKKKAALLIVGGMPPPGKLGKGEPDGDEGDSAGDDQDGEAAVLASSFGQLRAAIKSGDDEAGAEAFVDLVKMCQRYKGGSYRK